MDRETDKNPDLSTIDPDVQKEDVEYPESRTETNDKPLENFSCGTTPVLTSFPEALNAANIDENEMKDIDLYEADISTVEEIVEEETIKNGIKDAEHKQNLEWESNAAGEGHQYSYKITEFESYSSIGSQLGKTIMIHSIDETVEETFERLKQACIDGTLPYKDTVDSLFNTLVGGSFDLESRYVLENPENVNRMLELIDLCPPNIQAEIWSIFLAIVKKSFFNLQATSKAGLIEKLLDRLSSADSMIADLLIQLLTVLTSYSISVKELKLFIRHLQATNASWKRNSAKLLNVMEEMPKRDGPDVFFSFPGKAHAGIILPPLTRWPQQNGWAFSTWFRMDPLNSVYFEREKPYLFCFSNSKGLGYFCYFMGGCLILRCIRSIGKEVIKCVKHEFIPRKWYHIALSFVYSRWGRGEIHCFVDGCLVEVIDANWLVSTNDHFSRCFLGCGYEQNVSEAYSGQLAAIYVFSQSITSQQAACLFYLGPSYQSQFKHGDETNLPDNYKNFLFDGKLNEYLIFAYCPKDCHGQLVLSHLPGIKTSINNYFVQVPHAVMKNGVEVITTHSIHNSLHSIGGIQILLPLFSQIDMKLNSSDNIDICTKLLSVIGTLLNTSFTAQQQFLHSSGFTVICSQIISSSRSHLTMELLETFISISNSLVNFSSGIPLLKQLVENIFYASHLWIQSDSSVQVRLYNFLANDFFSNPSLLQIVRRTQTIVILMNTLKKYFWITPPVNFDATENDAKLDRSVIVHIRTCILKIVDYFMFNLPTDSDEKNINRDEDFQCILNFISTVHEDDNCYDVLTQLMRQVAKHPAILVPAFDRKKAVCVIFSLISSSNELIRIPALKMFGYYLCRSTQKRKNESINTRNLFYLLTDKLMLNNRSLTLATYNALYEILVEQICPEILFVKHEEPPLDTTRFENPQILKVIAQLLYQSEESQEVLRVKRIFLHDIINLCKDSRENRRIILQMSVWQEWLISLSYIFPENEEQNVISELVCQLFSILLFHAIRFEYGGWRVWVDTMAVAHSKISWQKYCRENLSREQRFAQNVPNIDNSGNEQSISAALYRTPEFVWSKVQVQFLTDLLNLIRSVVQEWKESSTAMPDHLNNSDNQVFISNTIHILSQLTDSLVMAYGGLLPLLAAATAPNSELDIFDTTQQELSISQAAYFLDIFAELADIFIFNSAVNLSELEQEKNMPAGGILRQSLRLVSTVAVRNILYRISENERTSKAMALRYESIRNFIKDKPMTPECSDHLLQILDLQRLKGVIYRDMEETKQAQFLALAVVYFLSVLMVSRYRDILEPPSSLSPFFGTKTNGSFHKEAAGEDHEITQSADVNTSKNNNLNPNDVGECENLEKQQTMGIASIKLSDTSKEETKEYSDENKYETAHLSRFNTGNLSQSSVDNSLERRQYLTDKLKNSLEPVIPLFREILTDFRPFLQKTLLGTHAQEIMNDQKVMQTLKNGGVIEIVMLLCSQEWQTSLQKHAGLAFIELVNEGRLMAHATRDHILRVSNEADFILNRLRAEDVSKHAQFESETNEQFSKRKTEEQLSDQLILFSKRREIIMASKLLEKLRNLLTCPTGAWSIENDNSINYTKLDVWEDDSRRKRRFIHNPYGQNHSILSNPKSSEQNGESEKMFKDLSHLMMSATNQTKLNKVRELIDEAEIEKWLKEESNEPSEYDEDQASFSTNGKLIAPGVIVPGTITLTATDLYFDADDDHPILKHNLRSLRHCDILHCRWNFQEIRAIFLRRYLLEYTALELFLASRTAIMFAFTSSDVVKSVVSMLPPCGIGVKYGLPQSRKSSLMTPWQLFKHSNMPQKWQQREISNFDYLMFLNTIAGRTYNDLNQYPIFPWILSNYSSENLDLNNASNFRDLSKPIGALSESRRKHFQDRFSNWDDSEIPAFHYGTHYSTQAFTLNWLFRIEPFTSYFLELNGRFDHSNRLFHSIAETWEHCLTDTHDVKELIPELFYLSEMFYNLNNYNLGSRDDGSIVSDVILPPWAKNGEEFVKTHRKALESDLVSCQLNQWIDLVFGYKQRGTEAIRAINVFYHLTYEGSVNLHSIENATLRESIQEQISNFGQTPPQLMTEPHPPRHSLMTISPLMFKPNPDDLCMLMKFISNSPVVHITANTFSQVENPTLVTISQNLVFALNRWNPNYNQSQKQSLFENEKNAQTMDTPISPSELPITVDPLLAVGNPTQKLPKRFLGDPFDQRLEINPSNFVCSVDSKYIIACGYPDYSFRVIETENAQVRQVIYGHGDVVTCLSRSETTIFADCYIASGSADCTVVLWHFSQHLGAIAGEYNAPGESPNPRIILTGHEAVISSISVLAEHGLIISGSKNGTVLIHTTSGDLLRNILCADFEGKTLPINNILFNRDCHIAVFYGQQNIATFTTTGKQLNRPFFLSKEKILCAALTRDGEFIVVGTECGRISILRMFPLQLVYTFAQTDSPIRSVAISTNQRLIFGGLDSGAIVVFNMNLNRFDSSRISQK